MKYEVGDRVKVKSLDWYNKHTNGIGVDCGAMPFMNYMTEFCNEIVTISDVNSEDEYYDIEEDGATNGWTDEMFEGLAEEEKVSNVNSITQDRVDILACKFDEELPSGNPYEWECPDGYIFKDENGNVINATKIVLEKKKKEYPKTYEECEKVLRYDSHRLDNMGVTVRGYKWELIRAFQILLICRDAYWKIAGEEMGLGKPWKPDFSSHTEKFSISVFEKRVVCIINQYDNIILTFPTREMRYAFYENFKELIEQCKELL